MMNIKMIPDEAMNAAHKHLPLYSKHQILIALAAALNAWPGMRISWLALNDGAIVLPLPQEASDE